MPAAAIYSILLKKENAHDDPIYCCEWTRTCTTSDPKGPSKEFVLTGGLDNLVKVWMVENNRLELVQALTGHEMAVMSVAVSPDGHSIASSSLDSMLIIWDLLSGQKVHEVETGATDVWKLVFSPDGSQVATGSHTGKVIIYGIKDGTVDRILDTRGKFVLSVAWSPNGKYISCGSVDGTVCVFDVSQGKLVHTVEAHRQAVRSVVFAPNSLVLASASDDGTVKLHTVASAGHIATLEIKSIAVCVAFSPDGSRVAAAAGDGTVRVAQADDLKVLHTFHEHTDTVWDIRFNGKGDKLLSIAKDKCINIYECPVPQKQAKK
ncbi:superkiller complex protein 8-like [Ostrinia nubilalis]|uniref:superkiller complex protein 8-like n=1 Tax=Ostrinia nubilalis TaxID=29057 RepID=UPI0030822FB4